MHIPYEILITNRFKSATTKSYIHSENNPCSSSGFFIFSSQKSNFDAVHTLSLLSRLHKLQAKEDQRAELAQRTQKLSVQEEEDLGWDDEPGDEDASPINVETESASSACASSPVAASASKSSSIPPDLKKMESPSTFPESNPSEQSNDVPEDPSHAGSIQEVESPPLDPSEEAPVSKTKLAIFPNQSEESIRTDGTDETDAPSAQRPVIPQTEGETSSEGSGGKEWSVVSSPSKGSTSPVEAGDEQRPKQRPPTARGPPGATGEGDEDLDWGNWD